MVDLLVVLFFPAVLTVLLSIAELRIKYAEKELLNKRALLNRSALLFSIYLPAYRYSYREQRL